MPWPPGEQRNTPHNSGLHFPSRHRPDVHSRHEVCRRPRKERAWVVNVLSGISEDASECGRLSRAHQLPRNQAAGRGEQVPPASRARSLRTAVAALPPSPGFSQSLSLRGGSCARSPVGGGNKVAKVLPEAGRERKAEGSQPAALPSGMRRCPRTPSPSLPLRQQYEACPSPPGRPD